jgi:hypothetical protein
MTNTLDITPTSPSGIRAITGKWGWFVALGISELILGGVASTNLLLANLASVLFIGAAVLVVCVDLSQTEGGVLLYPCTRSYCNDRSLRVQ